MIARAALCGSFIMQVLVVKGKKIQGGGEVDERTYWLRAQSCLFF